MRICIFGAGSLGSALGGLLSLRNEVVLIGRRPHMNAVKRNGLRLTGDKRLVARVEARESVARISPPDLIIISTKSFDTRDAIRSCKGIVDDRTRVLTLQNGIGNLELLRKWLGKRAFGGTTTLGAAVAAPGEVRISGLGETVIGADLDRLGANRLADELRACGLSTSVDKDISRVIWSKAVVNACINPTAAILRVPNGRLIQSKAISQLMREVCHECEIVAEVSGAGLLTTSLYPRVRAVCRDTAENISSMLQDVRAGKQTEIEQINGAFCRHGDIHRIPTPLNDALVAMILGMGHTCPSEKG